MSGVKNTPGYFGQFPDALDAFVYLSPRRSNPIINHLLTNFKSDIMTDNLTKEEKIALGEALTHRIEKRIKALEAEIELRKEKIEELNTILKGEKLPF